MKRLVIKLSVVAVFFAIIVALVMYVGLNKVSYSCVSFRYQNYIHEDVEIVGLSKIPISIDQLINITRTLYDYTENTEEVNETLKEILFQQRIINSPGFYNEIYDETKANTQFYDLGTVNISNRFETHLILSVYTYSHAYWESGDKTLYMLNMNQNQLKSIVIVAQYLYDMFDSSLLLSIQKIKSTKFVLKRERESIRKQKPNYCRFSLDSEGYVVVEN